MNQFKFFFYFLLICYSFIKCTKTDTPNTTDNNNGNADVHASLFIDVIGDFVKVDASADTLIWQSHVVNLFGSAGNPMVFDSNYFYHGNRTGITCYNARTGIPVWNFTWLIADNREDATGYREATFNDSLLFVTSPTNAWDHANLFCLYKNTGAAKWQQQLDDGSTLLLFNAVPVIYKNMVIVETQDYNNHTYLSAFNVADKSLVWKTERNDSLSGRILLQDNKIYSVTSRFAFCYDADSGKPLWKTDMQIDDYRITAGFLDENKLVVMKVKKSDYNILILNKANGNIMRTTQINIPSTEGYFYSPIAGCAYRNNILYIATAYAYNVIQITAYDVNAMTQTWSTKYNGGLGGTPIVTDKYLIFPVNEEYKPTDPVPSNHSKMLFTNLAGKVVKEVPFTAVYPSVFTYSENGIIYNQYHFYFKYFL